MDRPKRTVKRPQKYEAQEDTPKVKRKSKKKTEEVREEIGAQERDDVEEISSVDEDCGLVELDKATPKSVEKPVVRNTSGRYEAEYSKTSRAKCRQCQTTVNKGELRIGKMVPIEMGYNTGMGLGWWHLSCFFRQHSHIMTWTDFKGVEVLKVEDQEKLHLIAVRCAMPASLATHIASVLQAVQAEDQQEEDQQKAIRAEDAAHKREEGASRKENMKESSTEQVIRDEVAKIVDKKTVDQLKAIISINNITVEKESIGKGKGKSKKSKAPKKADYQNAIINAEPLWKIGSLVQRAIRKHIKVDELKVLLGKAGLACTGSKPELTKRLLTSFGGDFGEESEDEEVAKKGRKKFDFDDCYMTNNDFYEKDEKDPDIVVAARNGNLSKVQDILRKTVRPLATLNASRKWTEVEEKWGYDKSWDWHGETPLLAASRSGHYEVVYYLLLQEADPTLEGCYSDNVHETPIQAVNKQIATASSIRKKKYTIVKNLLEVVAPFWSRASYAHSSYSDERKKSFARQPNKPLDSQQLQSTLAAVSLDIGPDRVLAESSSIVNSQQPRVSPSLNANAPAFVMNPNAKVFVPPT